MNAPVVEDGMTRGWREMIERIKADRIQWAKERVVCARRRAFEAKVATNMVNVDLVDSILEGFLAMAANRESKTTALSCVDETIRDFRLSVTSCQLALIQAVNADDPLLSALSQADARRAILKASTKEIKEYLAGLADPQIAMVEVVPTKDQSGNAVRPSQEAIAETMCIALMNGFVPGKDQFSIFARRDLTAQLYVKKAGFERWFAHLEKCSIPNIGHEHPQFKRLGTSDKQVWVAEGHAEVTYKGKEYCVIRRGKEALGITGYATDQIANVSAKMKRALMRQLWQLVSSYGLDSVDDEGDDASVNATTAKTVIDVQGAISERGSSSPKTESGSSDNEPVNADDNFSDRWRKQLVGLSYNAKEYCAQLFERWRVLDSEGFEVIALQVQKLNVTDERERRRVALFVDAIRLDLKESMP